MSEASLIHPKWMVADDWPTWIVIFSHKFITSWMRWSHTYFRSTSRMAARNPGTKRNPTNNRVDLGFHQRDRTILLQRKGVI